jgi:hypothetical protein
MVAIRVRSALLGSAISFALSAVAVLAQQPVGPTYLANDSAGVRVVTNSAPSWDTPWVIEEIPTTIVGLGEPRTSPGVRVIGAVRLDDGRTVVAKHIVGTRAIIGQELVWYSPDGEALHKVDAKGEGPGEFRALMHLVRLGGDSIAAADMITERFQVFDPDGGYARSVFLPGGEVRFSALTRFDDGAFLIASLANVFPRQQPRTTTSVERVPLELQLVAEGRPAQSLATFAGQEFVMIPDPGESGMTLGDYRAFGRSTGVVANRSGWVIGDNDRAELQYWSLSGELRQLSRWPQQPREVTPENVLAEIEIQAWGGLNPDSSRAVRYRERLLGYPAAPATMPFFDSALLMDPLGNVWVKEYTPRFETSAERYNVLDATGVWLGSVSVPQEITLLSVGTDHVLGKRQLEADVDLVAVHRLIKP